MYQVEESPTKVLVDGMPYVDFEASGAGEVESRV